MSASRHSPTVSRSSTASADSSNNEDIVDSSAPLILVHDSENGNTNNSPFDLTSDTDDDDLHDMYLETIRRSAIPPLPPTTVFLYLLSQYLRLGALYLVDSDLTLKIGIPVLVFFSLLSAFSRQLLYMLAKYTRNRDLEEIILDAFARGRGKERLRVFLRTSFRSLTSLTKLLLASVYLKESVEILLPLLPERPLLPIRITLSALLSLAVFPISIAPSIAYKRVIYATWLSIAAYLASLVVLTYTYTRGTVAVNSGLVRMSTLWNGPTTTAFAFASSSTLSLYAALKAGMKPQAVTTKTPKSHSFQTISLLAVVLGTLLTLPPVLFSPSNSTDDLRRDKSQNFMAVTYALTLTLSIPSVLITTPTLPVLVTPVNRIYISRCLFSLVIFGLALVPSHITVLSDILLVLALLGTYVLPALLHITLHYFRRPLAIVINPRRSSVGDATPVADDLLQRKERALQRRQLRRRIVWDVCVWLMFVGGVAWAVWSLGRGLKKW